MNAHPRTFTVTDGKREHVPLLIGLMGPSGCGKTMSALEIATGIQQVVGGDIYGIDTEARRMLHYADGYKFKHLDFKPPFGSLDYLEAIRFCVNAGAKTIIVDSMTHEHVGDGGYLERAEAKVFRLAGDDYKKREKMKLAGWAEVGPLRTRMIEGIKQLDVNLICCFRAKEKTKPAMRDGKLEIIPMGFMPIAGEELVYEMTVNCLLLPKANGVPTWRSDHIGERMMMKEPEQFKGIFANSVPLSKDIGRKLAEWAKGGEPAKDEPMPSDAELRMRGAEEAARGEDALKSWWDSIGKPARTRLKDDLPAWRKLAIDAAPAEDDEI
jgi:ABC-type dipeptide/oligopeptide/nickel transport system ATPase subunit